MLPVRSVKFVRPTVTACMPLKGSDEGEKFDVIKENVSERTRELQTMCRKHVMEQFALDK